MKPFHGMSRFLTLTREQIADVIATHALLAEGGERLYRLTKQDGTYAGTIYQSDIEPHLWMFSRGAGLVDAHEDRDVLARRNGILIPPTTDTTEA